MIFCGTYSLTCIVPRMFWIVRSNDMKVHTTLDVMFFMLISTIKYYHTDTSTYTGSPTVPIVKSSKSEVPEFVSTFA